MFNLYIKIPIVNLFFNQGRKQNYWISTLNFELEYLFKSFIPWPTSDLFVKFHIPNAGHSTQCFCTFYCTVNAKLKIISWKVPIGINIHVSIFLSFIKFYFVNRFYFLYDFGFASELFWVLRAAMIFLFIYSIFRRCIRNV